VFGALQEIGYQGPIVMEPFITSDGDALREMWIYRDLLTGGSLDEEASRSLRFVRSELKSSGAQRPARLAE
jgi:D-psicose/D-tagatose/L-ribulose 3-epimerase